MWEWRTTWRRKKEKEKMFGESWKLYSVCLVTLFFFFSVEVFQLISLTSAAPSANFGMGFWRNAVCQARVLCSVSDDLFFQCWSAPSTDIIDISRTADTTTKTSANVGFFFLLRNAVLLSLDAHNHVDDYSGTLGGVRKSTFQLWSQVLKIKLLHCQAQARVWS